MSELSKSMLKKKERVCVNNWKLILLQILVTEDITSNQHMRYLTRSKQEQASLVCIPDSFKKKIVVESRMPLWRNEQGITIMNICDFLLDENSLDK